jgi:hypothetical protein
MVTWRGCEVAIVWRAPARDDPTMIERSLRMQRSYLPGREHA